MINPVSFILLSLFVIISYYIYLKLKPGNKARVKDLYSEGLDMMVLGQLNSAYHCFKTIINDDTNNIPAYLKLGQVVREAKNPKQALKIHKSLILRKKISIYEKMELYKNLSLDYFYLKDYNNSILESEKILDLDKKNEWAIEHLIKIYRTINDWNKATIYLVKLHKIKNIDKPSEIGKYKIQEGRQLLKNNDFKSSRALFEESLNIDEKLHKAYLYIGNSYAKESDEIYSKSQDINPIKTDNMEHQDAYNELYDNAKQLLSKAIAMWVKYIENSTDDTGKIIGSIKDGLYALNRFDELESILKQIIAKHPENIHALTHLADFYDHKGEEQNSFELLEKAKEKSPNSIFVKAMYIKFKLKKENLIELSSKMDTLIQGIGKL